MTDLLDIVDVNTVQQAIGVPDSGLALLEGYITVVSRHIDGLCGPVVQRTVTAEEHSGGDTQIVLYTYPVVSIATVTENGTTVAASGYHINTRSGIIERLSSTYVNMAWAPGRWNIVVTYLAGRYTTTATVGSVFAQAATMAVQGLWESQQSQGGTQTFGPAADSLDVLDSPAGKYVLPKAAWMLLSGANELKPLAKFA